MNDDDVGGATAIRFGLATLVVAFGGFGTWAATAPLDSAAVANGEVQVESYRKTVQHREGGIVKTILVRDGTTVQAGQPLVLLDDTAVRASWDQMRSQLWDALGNKARLVAERDGATSIDFARVFADADQPRIHEVRRGQENLFQARRTMLDGQIAVLNRRIEQMNHEAEALRVERLSADRQLQLVDDEVATVEKLVRRGLALKPRLLALQREAAKLQGSRDDYAARIARIGQTIEATRLEIANVTYRQMDEVATELREVDTQIRDLEQRITTTEDALNRTVVRAPQPGIVVGLKIHTIGGVLQPGEAVMDIVPQNESLVVEAHVKPEDIDRVYPGREAHVRFHTFVRGLTPPVAGQVSQVSADLLRDERTGKGYYLARVRLDPQAVTRLPGPLVPGMQSDVLITTGERTTLEYLLAPLVRAMDGAMREK